jgi:hypothetical protein
MFLLYFFGGDDSELLRRLFTVFLKMSGFEPRELRAG